MADHLHPLWSLSSLACSIYTQLVGTDGYFLGFSTTYNALLSFFKLFSCWRHYKTTFLCLTADRYNGNTVFILKINNTSKSLQFTTEETKPIKNLCFNTSLQEKFGGTSNFHVVIFGHSSVDSWLFCFPCWLKKCQLSVLLMEMSGVSYTLSLFHCIRTMNAVQAHICFH